MMMDSRDFLFSGRHLSVRASAFSEGWRVRIYAGDQPATAVIYTITHENMVDAAAACAHLVSELMTLAQSDVEEGRVRLLEGGRGERLRAFEVCRSSDSRNRPLTPTLSPHAGRGSSRPERNEKSVTYVAGLKCYRCRRQKPAGQAPTTLSSASAAMSW
jgi:hypothetical protein